MSNLTPEKQEEEARSLWMAVVVSAVRGRAADGSPRQSDRIARMATDMANHAVADFRREFPVVKEES